MQVSRMTTCCRLSQHLRGCDVGSYSRARQSSIMASSNFLYSTLKPYDNRLQKTSISSSAYSPHVGCLRAKSPGESPVLSECSSQQEDDRELLSEGPVSVKGGIVALGKFDALHIGHRELAIQASKVGIPFLLSFVGIAEVLGWEPRAPIVAKCDRNRVLSSWAPYCGNVAPAEVHVEFSSVRHLTPRQFVEKLSKELGVGGVVAGENYRFGYKAAGDALELVRLCEEFGIGAYIVSSVMDKNQSPRIKGSAHPKERGQVSSTRVRRALSEGDMKYVSELLGRKHRLMLMLLEQEGIFRKGNRVSAPKSCLLNLPPNEGLYENCSILIDGMILVPCSTVLDTTHIHVELDENDAWSQVLFQDHRLIGIEFGDS